MSHPNQPSSKPKQPPSEKQEETHQEAKEALPGSQDVSRRRFLTMSVGLTTALAVPTLMESCGEPNTGKSENGPDDTTNAEVFRDKQSQEAGREASQAEPDSTTLDENSYESGAETRDANGDEGIEAHNESVNEPIPEMPGVDAEVDLRNESTPESKVVAFDIKQFSEDRALFSLGVSAGAMRSDSVMLWTFLDKPTQTTVRVWEDGPRPGAVVMHHDRTINSNADGYLKLKLSGLQPSTWYDYAFFQGQKRSVVGRFRTAFAPGSMMPLTLGAATCTKNQLAPFESLKMMAQENIDLFVHLGDMSYNDNAKDLAGYRKLWRGQIQAGGYKELLPHTGMYMTWDDHEVDNNWDPETFDKKRLQAAKQAFFETLPVERGPGDQLWRSYQWGDTAEILVMDSRSERKPSTRKTKNAVYLGAAQLAWLKDRLKKSTAHFKILMNSVPMTNMPAIWVSTADRWEGYKAQREEVLNYITTEKIKNTWFLSGDFHVGFVGRLEKSGPLSKTWEVAVGPSDSLPNPLGLALGNAQFPYHSSNTRVMTTLTFDPKADEVRIRFVDANKKILFDKIITPQT